LGDCSEDLNVPFTSIEISPLPPAFTLTDEIPRGLQLIANAAGHTLLLNGQKPVQKRVLAASIFRLIVGYLFLSSLFINIAQNDDVIEIFYGERVKQMLAFLGFCRNADNAILFIVAIFDNSAVLALEFVENIDGTTFALGT